MLIISPQNLGDDSVELIGHTQLKHLHIFQNRYSPNDLVVKSVSRKSWKNCRKNNPKLCVHLELQSNKERQLIWQDYAPVKTVIYDSPHIGVSEKLLFNVN